MVRSGLASPSEFRLLLGLAGWAPQQLSDEIAAGVWYCVAASKSLVMAPEGGLRRCPVLRGLKYQGGLILCCGLRNPVWLLGG
jgi:putative AlgH/UPF0301 family transcriptional regulator